MVLYLIDYFRMVRGEKVWFLWHIDGFPLFSEILAQMKFHSQLLPDRCGGRPENSLSLRSHGGGTPPLLAPGRVTPPRHILGVKLVLLWVAATGNGWF